MMDILLAVAVGVVFITSYLSYRMLAKELEKLRNRIINEQDIRHKQVVELQQLNKKCWQQLSGISYKISGKQRAK